jgi:hypothetical protein
MKEEMKLDQNPNFLYATHPAPPTAGKSVMPLSPPSRSKMGWRNELKIQHTVEAILELIFNQKMFGHTPCPACGHAPKFSEPSLAMFL